jgi:hypothetical protein
MSQIPVTLSQQDTQEGTHTATSVVFSTTFFSGCITSMFTVQVPYRIVFTNASPLSVKADNFKHSGPALWYDMAVFEPIEINE